jgi:phasin
LLGFEAIGELDRAADSKDRIAFRVGSGKSCREIGWTGLRCCQCYAGASRQATDACGHQRRILCMAGDNRLDRRDHRCLEQAVDCEQASKIYPTTTREINSLARRSASGPHGDNCEKIKAASGEIADSLREAYSTNAKGVADYGSKVIEISGVNTNSAFDFLTNLMDTKSLSEIIHLSATQSRKNFEVTSAQNRELWEIAQKVATETAEPIKKSFTRVLQKAS